MSGKTTVIIFTGFNQRAVVAFLRVLSRFGISIAIIAASADDSILKTDYAKYCLAVRKIRQLNLDDLLVCLDVIKSKTSSDKLFIAPSTEALNRFLLEHRKTFESSDCIIPLPNKELYESISDKYSFSRLCKDFGIPIPSESENYDELGLPFVAKPKTYFYADSQVFDPQLIFTAEDKSHFESNYPTDAFYYQKFINGKSLYLLYYIDKEKQIYRLSQENILQQPFGKSIIATAVTNVHCHSFSVQYESLIKSLGFRGLIMIEIRESCGTYYMIEANPRFWGPSQLFLDADFNLFAAFLYDYDLLPEKPLFSDPKPAKYFWHGGLMETLSKGLTPATHLSMHTYDDSFIAKWISADIYKRDDTMEIYNLEILAAQKDSLRQLCLNQSKHSFYQTLPRKMTALIGDLDLPEGRRYYEANRLKYILNSVDVCGKTVADIGGNTGYFSFEMIDAGAKSVSYYEGNSEHAAFVALAAKICEVADKIYINNNYFQFDDSFELEHYDIVLLLNVLHHLGDDFGDKTITIEEAKKRMAKHLCEMASKATVVVFQLGFNWKGNRMLGLFENGTKQEMIDFVKNAIDGFFTVEKIGIPSKTNGEVVYEDLTDKNVQRDDSLGEFLNRPLFILRRQP